RADRRRRQEELRSAARRLSPRAQRRARSQLWRRAQRADFLLSVQRPLAHPGDRREAADRPPAARQGHHSMARGARSARREELYGLPELRGAQSRHLGALAPRGGARRRDAHARIAARGGPEFCRLRVAMADQELPVFLGLNDKSITALPATIDKQ